MPSAKYDNSRSQVPSASLDATAGRPTVTYGRRRWVARVMPAVVSIAKARWNAVTSGLSARQAGLVDLEPGDARDTCGDRDDPIGWPQRPEVERATRRRDV